MCDRLKDLKDVKARDALKQRGGNNSAISQADDSYWNAPLGEVANKAAAGDAKAETVMKLVKQAGKSSKIWWKIKI